jgi:hypothetical protein
MQFRLLTQSVELSDEDLQIGNRPSPTELQPGGISRLLSR